MAGMCWVLGLSTSWRPRGGRRPTKYRVKWGGKKDYRHTPSKELIAQLREADVRMVKPDTQFETFLADFQIRSGLVDACRMCLLDERFTPLNRRQLLSRSAKARRSALNAASANCAVRCPIWAGWGWRGSPISKTSCSKFRNLDRVLATLQPEKIRWPSPL